MHAIINPQVVFDPFCLFIDDGVGVGVGGFKFSVGGIVAESQMKFNPKKHPLYTQLHL